MKVVFDVERPIIELEQKIAELKQFASERDVDLQAEIEQMERRLEEMKRKVYSNLTPWQRVQFARHPDRPYTLDYISMITEEFMELHGDRLYGDDRAIVGGIAKFDGEPIMIIGHQKGRNLKENLYRNFGCAHPEGYRKALRLMRLAEKSHLPIIIFIDTPGAYPGIGAEERGQAHAIAENIRAMFSIATPILVYVIGEGGSGGALGIGVGDKVSVMENAYYSVISPEGCAAILWKSSEGVEEAASALKLTAQDLLNFGIIDAVIPEPLGGAHRYPEEAGRILADYIRADLKEIRKIPIQDLLRRRYDKFRNIGVYEYAQEEPQS